jgi:hypothetical protein
VRQGCVAGSHACVGGNHEAFLVDVLFTEVPELFQAGINGAPRRAQFTLGLEMRHRLEYAGGGLPLSSSFEDYRLLARARWFRSGGRETLASFGCDPDDVATWRLPPETVSFLVGLPLLWEYERGVVTHAFATAQTLSAGRALQARAEADPAGFHTSLTEPESLLLDSLVWSRELPKERPDPDKVHACGHTPLERPHHDRTVAVVNVDTACVFGNLLTGFCFETEEFLSVPGWQGDFRGR